MSSPPPLTPAERFATILRCIGQSVASRTGWALTLTLIAQIADRIRFINQRFARLTARIAAGTYRPRRPPAAPRQKHAAAKPRRPDPLPREPGWLVKLIPEATGYRAQLEHLFRDPEMAALLAAAPEAMRRPVRALCRMLGAPPPPVLALPVKSPKPRKPRKPPAAKPPPPPELAPPELPAWMRIGPQRKPWSLARIRGSPHRR